MQQMQEALQEGDGGLQGPYSVGVVSKSQPQLLVEPKGVLVAETQDFNN